MPNRILKESICTSDTVDSLSWFEECFFYRLIVSCDDFGRMDARPPILRSRLFPLRPITTKQVEDALKSLRTAGIVDLYTVDGRLYLQLRTWGKHQQVRAKKSKFPEPVDGYLQAGADNNQSMANDCKVDLVQQSDIICNQSISDDCKCPRNPIQSESNPNPNRESESTRTRAKKTQYAEFVKMSESEYDKLVEDHGESAVKRMIEILDNYKGANGKTYKSDYRAICNWVIRRYEEERIKGGSRKSENNDFSSKPSYDLEEFERFSLENTPKIGG